MKSKPLFFTIGSIALAMAVVSGAPAVAGTKKPAAAPAAPAAPPAPKSLYERLGGYDAIAAVVDDFANRLRADPELKVHFGGFSDDRLAQFKAFNIQLVCQATGGPCTYQGRSMPLTHQGSMIDNALFDRVAWNLNASLDKFKVPAQERSELVKIVESLRPQIVDVKG